MIRYLYFFLIILNLPSCKFNNSNSKDIDFTFIHNGEKLNIKDSVVDIIKEYRYNHISKSKFIGLFGRSFPNRNNIFILMGLSGFTFKNTPHLPTAYSILDGVPVVIYLPDSEIFQKTYTDACDIYNKTLNDYVKTDTLVGLYSPHIWVIELNKDSTRLYKSKEEYDKKVDFYQPSD